MDKFNYACTYAYVRGINALSMAKNKIKERVDAVVNDESGMAIIEIILILVIVLAIVIIFRKQIGELVNNIFGKMNEETEELLSDESMITTTVTTGGEG